MKLLTIALFFMLIGTGLAGMRRAPVPHAITSPGGGYVFTMIPGPKGEEREKGYGVCYKVGRRGEFLELWRTHGWYSDKLELHIYGDILVRTGSWSSDQEIVDFKNSLALAFYKSGKEIARYTISELVKDQSKLQYTTAGLRWIDYEHSFGLGPKMFLLHTLDGIRYQFDPYTGKITEAKSEQGGADQPATRSESESEGGDKPKPELDPRPQ